MESPTVADVLDASRCAGVDASGDTLHNWHVEGGVITVPASQLRPALEAAHDPAMRNWQALISWEDGEFHVA